MVTYCPGLSCRWIPSVLLGILLAIVLMLLPAATASTDSLRDAVIPSLLGKPLTDLHWQKGSEGQWGDRQNLLNTSGEKVATVETDLSTGRLVYFSLSPRQELPSTGRMLSDDELIEAGRLVLKQLVPESWDVDTLMCKLGDELVRGARFLELPWQ